MDQIKIGKFIADERKRKGYTQKQLSEKLEISDKTISKWECGNGFPDTSLIMPLCEILKISSNELLSGKDIGDKDYKENDIEVISVSSISEKCKFIFLHKLTLTPQG